MGTCNCITYVLGIFLEAKYMKENETLKGQGFCSHKAYISVGRGRQQHSKINPESNKDSTENRVIEHKRIG